MKNKGNIKVIRNSKVRYNMRYMVQEKKVQVYVQK